MIQQNYEISLTYFIKHFYLMKFILIYEIPF